MSLDDRLRHALRDEADSVDTRTPKLEHLERGARRRRIERRLLSAAAAAVLLVVAVVFAANIDTDATDKETKPQPADTPTVSPSESEAAFPKKVLGRYTTTLEPGKSATRLSADGKWSLKLTADGYEALGPEDFRPFFGTLSGTYTVEGNRVTLGPSSHCDELSEYELSLSGSELSFDPISEKCLHRRVVFSTEVWTRR